LRLAEQSDCRKPDPSFAKQIWWGTPKC